MKYNVVVTTHHKTGTVWMADVFRAVATDLGATFVDYWTQPELLERGLERPFILFNDHSDFRGHPDLLSRDDVRILHLIRDPRDVLISAMHYHRKADEAWLREPMPGCGTLTYQGQLNACTTRHEQYLFEMENSTWATLCDMQRWRYGRANCVEARYEALRHDTRMAQWSGIVDFLGFDAAEQQACRERFWQHSLFGRLRRGHAHVRSGAVAQWKREFTPELAAAFGRKFPGVLQSLGYEPDDRWVSDLQGRGVAARLLSRVLASPLGRQAGRPLERLNLLARRA